MARGKVEPKSSRRRQEILTGALQSFTAKGFAETTMTDIQQRSGASVGSIYHHFESKERLAADLYLEGLRSLHKEILQVLETTSDAEAGIKGMVQTYVVWFEKNPDWGHYLFQAMGAQYLEVAGGKIREESITLRRVMAEWLRPHLASGLIATLPKELYSPLLFGPTREFLQQWLVHRAPADMSGISRQLADAAWRALTC